MREIKFRAWDGEQKMMMSWNDINHFRLISVRQNDVGFSFMQYTGLLDKNGKEIYEGDIVKWGVFPKKDIPVGDFVIKKSGQEKIGEVFYERGSFNVKNFYEASQDNPCDAFGEREELEVIGNIYENPELLKP